MILTRKLLRELDFLRREVKRAGMPKSSVNDNIEMEAVVNQGMVVFKGSINDKHILILPKHCLGKLLNLQVQLVLGLTKEPLVRLLIKGPVSCSPLKLHLVALCAISFIAEYVSSLLVLVLVVAS